MDSTALDRAYAQLVQAVDEIVVAPVSSHHVPSGEWDADQQLAHLIAVDAGILAVTSSVAAGSRPAFDNRLSLDAHNLADISQRFAGLRQMRDRVQAQGRALCELASSLTEEELNQPVPALLVSQGVTVVDQAVSLGDLLSGIAGDHLPRHTQQLLDLLPPRPAPDTPA